MFEIDKWYEYQLKGSRKKIVGQCIGVSKLFVTFKTGLEYKPGEDTLVETQNLVDRSIIKTYELIPNRYVGTASRGNKDHYIRTDK